MKASIVAASLLTLAAAQPHGHAQFHKRQAVETDVTYVTADPVIDYVCVDDSGASIPCPPDAQAAPAPPSYGGSAPAPAATPAPAAPVVVSPAPVAPAPVSPAPVAPGSTGAGAPGAGAPSTGAGSSTGSAPGSGSTGGSAPSQVKGLGIAYSPYNTDQSCKSAAQVMADFDTIKGYGAVRIYNTDCNQAANVAAAARKHDMEIMAGIFKIDNLQQDVSDLITQLNHNFDGITTVVIGNELVNSNQNSVDQVVGAIGSARAQLRSAGYNGPVVTVDTNNVVLNLDKAHPDGIKLCTASDYCAFNAHPFFAPVAAGDSGTWARDQVSQAAKMSGGQRVVIAECGWPSGGDPNKMAIPSPENQQTAVAAIHAEFSTDMYMFTAFNDYWKAPGAFNSEQFWGIMGNSNQ